MTLGEGNLVTVKGPKGTLTQKLSDKMTITKEENVIHVTRPNDAKENRALHGLTRTLLHNMVVGVTEGYKKELDVNGVGYRVAKEGKKLVMNIGYSHPCDRGRDRRYHHRGSQPQQDRHQRHRQAEGRPVRCRGQREETPGTLQGQGNQIY